MFEKFESDNTLLFTVVQATFLLIDASLESGVPKRVVECWALRPMGERILWWSTPCPATNLTMLLELFKHLTINLEQRQANSNTRILTHLPTHKGWKTELAELADLVQSNHRSGAGLQGKSADQRQTS